MPHVLDGECGARHGRSHPLLTVVDACEHISTIGPVFLLQTIAGLAVALVVDRGSSCFRGPAHGGPPRAAALDRIRTLTPHRTAGREDDPCPRRVGGNTSPTGRVASNERGCRATGSTLSGGTVTSQPIPRGPRRGAPENSPHRQRRALSVLSARRGRPDEHYRRSDSDAGSTPRQRPNQILRTWLACRPF